MKKSRSEKKVSIIIRTLNEDRHIGNLLDALEKQSYQDFEVIVVDSGSSDRTLNIVRQYDVNVIEIESRDFTFGYALNVGCADAVGDFLVFVSAHVLPVDENWLKNLINPFVDGKVAMVYGRQVGNENSKFSERMDFKRLFGLSSINSAVPLHYANNANSAVRRDLWKRHRFDEYLFGLEDIAWARTLAGEGYTIQYEPSAAIFHIHEERWYQVLNRYRREAIAAIRIGLDEPPQAKVNFIWMLFRVTDDVLHSFPDWRFARIDEIIRFRYFQWKGSRMGWREGRGIDFAIAKNSIFYPEASHAVVIRGVHHAEYVPVPIPEMRPGDMLIKVDYVGVCRTDIEVYEGTLGYYRDGVASYPIIPGHEFSGTIARIGSNNKLQERFAVGERVVGECILSRGETKRREEVGVINVNGAYSEYVVVPGNSVHKIPESVDQKTAVLTEPLAVVLRALRRAEHRLVAGVRVAVIGGGQIGQLSARVLAERGFSVTLFDRDENRLTFVHDDRIGKSINLDGFGEYGVVIEATGSQVVLERVLKDTRVDATIVLLGFPYGEMEYNFEDVVGKEKVLIGSVGADRIDFDAALALLSRLDMEPFISVVMPLSDFETAWETHTTFKHLKILLKP